MMSDAQSASIAFAAMPGGLSSLRTTAICAHISPKETGADHVILSPTSTHAYIRTITNPGTKYIVADDPKSALPRTIDAPWMTRTIDVRSWATCGKRGR